MIKYICDRCGKEIRKIGMEYDEIEIKFTNSGRTGTRSFDLCFECSKIFDRTITKFLENNESKDSFDLEIEDIRCP